MSTNTTTATSTLTNTNTNTNTNINMTNETISRKLTSRISNLTSSASKESIQTLTKWILFHCKHHPLALQRTLHQHMKTSTSTGTSTGTSSPQIVVVWNIVHDLCIAHSSISSGSGSSSGGSASASAGGDQGKWNSFSSFRGSLGESVVRPALEDLQSTLESGAAASAVPLQNMLKVRDNLQNMVQMWKQVNCFDSPTLVDEIRRLVVKIGKEDGSGAGSSVGSGTGAGAGAGAGKDSSDGAKKSSVENDTNTAAVDTQVAAVPAPEQDNEGDNDNDNNDDDDDDAVNFEADAGAMEEHDDHDDHDDPEVRNTGQDVAAVDKHVTIDSDTDTDMNKPASEQEEDAEMTNVDADADQVDSITTRTGTMQEDPKQDKPEPQTQETKKDTSKTNIPKNTKHEKQPKEFDFESEGIPEGKVQVRELSDPCKAISTMQITRDLRNDSTHNLATLLSAVPAGVFEACRTEAEAKAGATTDATKVDLVENMPTVPDDVLDLDVAGALANVKLHREIIQKQNEHRQKCIELLIKSRCKFGSVEAASLFYDLEGVMETLKKRKALVLDAMELEGLDFEAIGSGEDGVKDEKLGDFSWLSRDAAKKMRTE
jgi:hypothetical protein